MLAEVNEAYHTTIVMITHDPHIASNAKRMVKIIDGEIFEGDEKEDAS